MQSPVGRSLVVLVLALATGCKEESQPRAGDAAEAEPEEDASEAEPEEDASETAPEDDAAEAEPEQDGSAAQPQDDASQLPAMDGGDGDDGGIADAAADGRAPWGPPADAAPPAWPAIVKEPHSIRPWNGEMTADTSGTRARRPEFLWTGVEGASRYELELDGACSGAPAACAFSAPAIRVTVTEPRYRPDVDLPINTTPPVGRRYYWRWRACTDVACGEWAKARYVDVGRQQRDYDGDGYADLALYGGLSHAEFFRGGQVLDVTADQVLDATDASVQRLPKGVYLGDVEPLRDVNADGFSDWVAPTSTIFDDKADYAHAGGPMPQDGVLFRYETRFKYGYRTSFGSAGDLDADGQPEFFEAWGSLRGTHSAADAHVHILASPIDSTSSAREFFWASPYAPNSNSYAAGLGDVDGDGLDDLATVYFETPDAPEGNTQVESGNYSLTVSASAGTPLDWIGKANNAILWASEMRPVRMEGPGDLDGDSLPDLIVDRKDKLDIYLRRDPTVRAHTSLAAGRWDYGDFNGDGLVDIAIASAAQISLYHGGAELVPGPVLAVANVRKLLAAGDVNGDGFAEIIAQVGDYTWQLFLGGVAMDQTPDAVFELTPPILPP